VIIGAEGTPYHDGLFFFDVFFPSGYPNEPPVGGWEDTLSEWHCFLVNSF
jgi:ubiquitin-protein ligase